MPKRDDFSESGAGQPTALLWTYVPQPPIVLDSLNAQQQGAGVESVPSGILHGDALTLTSLPRLDGVGPIQTLDQTGWLVSYQALQQGIVQGSDLRAKLPAPENLLARSQELAAQGVVPVLVARLDYQTPNKRLVHEIRLAARKKEALALPDAPGNYLDSHTAFLATALLPEKIRYFDLLPPTHRGLAVKFRFDPEFFFSNPETPPEKTEVDLADGQGWRAVELPSTLEARYPEAGEKLIRLRCRYPEGEREAAFTFLVENEYRTSSLTADETWNLTATIAYQGSYATGTAYVYYGSESGVKHTALTRPILIADGFPGHDIDELIGDGMLNQLDFFTDLLQGGYDAVVLTYGNGSTYVQSNAYVAVECINRINGTASVRCQPICGGASMGGLVVRYALTYMEANHLDHNAAMYFSFDSPHQGANIPVSVQYFVRKLYALGKLPANKSQLIDLLNSNGAKQMISYYLGSSVDGTYLLNNSVHDQLMAELAGLGNYPSLPRKIAISCGSCTGVMTVDNHVRTIDWSGNLCAFGDTYSLPEAPDDKSWSKLGMLSLLLTDYYCESKYTYNYDGAPGGTADTWKALASALKSSGYGHVDNPYPDNCFIPSVSSLDVQNASDPCTTVPPQGADTPFDGYYIGSRNLDHVQIDYPIKRYFFKVLGIAEPVTLEPVQLLLSPLEISSNGAFGSGTASLVYDNEAAVHQMAVGLSSFEVSFDGGEDHHIERFGVGGSFLTKDVLRGQVAFTDGHYNQDFSASAIYLVVGERKE